MQGPIYKEIRLRHTTDTKTQDNVNDRIWG